MSASVPQRLIPFLAFPDKAGARVDEIEMCWGTASLEACWDLPADIKAVGKARQLTRETLNTWGLPALTEDVTAVVSELVTNAIVHGSTPITLSLYRHGRAVCGEVTDHGGTWPTLRHTDPHDEHGRGLAIVAAYTDRWGFNPTPDGKAVWFICTEPGSR